MRMGTRCISNSSIPLHLIQPQPSQKIGFLNPSCNFTYGSESERWLSSNTLPVYSQVDSQVPGPGFRRTIERQLDELDPKLRQLSLQIHGLWISVFEFVIL